jgi:hypothetical protein
MFAVGSPALEHCRRTSKKLVDKSKTISNGDILRYSSKALLAGPGTKGKLIEYSGWPTDSIGTSTNESSLLTVTDADEAEGAVAQGLPNYPQIRRPNWRTP